MIASRNGALPGLASRRRCRAAKAPRSSPFGLHGTLKPLRQTTPPASRARASMSGKPKCPGRSPIADMGVCARPPAIVARSSPWVNGGSPGTFIEPGTRTIGRASEADRLHGCSPPIHSCGTSSRSKRHRSEEIGYQTRAQFARGEQQPTVLRLHEPEAGDSPFLLATKSGAAARPLLMRSAFLAWLRLLRIR
jgi:hypothetical protein